MNEENSERFARLESHVAHLEHQLDQLNGVVIKQGRMIDRLAKQAQLQARALETAEIERAKSNNPKPPHY